jgi:hypothetical protein
MPHLDPDRLSLVALGDALTDDERAHLDTCDVCALELAELEHTVAVGRSTVNAGELESPPERVWQRISDELQLSGSAGAPPTPRRRRRGLTALFALAAAAVIVAGAAVVWPVVRPAPPATVASATLAALPQHPGASGAAQVVETPEGHRVVDVELDDDVADTGYREVWLLTADASELVSLGVLEGTTGSFTVPDDVDLRDYVLVDISQEEDDGDPAHSGDSIVRGELSFA